MTAGKQRSGVNIWNMLTIDEKRGIAYLPIAAPTFDRYGGDHKGANLFSDSVVAVNANTGKYLWHFQAVHHDIWDYDLDTPPVLLEVNKDGKHIPAIAVMNKDALLYILNRVTGEPIFGVTETPVPKSPIAGETAWPTQPIPNKPPQLARSSFSLDEVANLTPEQHAACEAMIEKDHLTGSQRFEPIPAGSRHRAFPGRRRRPGMGGRRLRSQARPVHRQHQQFRLYRKAGAAGGWRNGHDVRAGSSTARSGFIARTRPGASSPPSTSTPATSPGRCGWAFPISCPKARRTPAGPAMAGPSSPPAA